MKISDSSSSNPLTEKVISRLSLYRRLLLQMQPKENDTIYSHLIASLAGVSSAQVRRDLMTTGYAGSPNRGYTIRDLIAAISAVLKSNTVQHAAVVGAGQLGRAIVNHFSNRRDSLSIDVLFDIDDQLVGTMINDRPCLHMKDLKKELKVRSINLAILAIPSSNAQEAARALVDAGVRSIVNFAPISLDVPGGVYVADIDITTTIETAAYFARSLK